MATSSKDTESSPSPTAPEFAIGHDGKIAGIYQGRDHRHSWDEDDRARLELAERPKVVEPKLPLRVRAPKSQRRKMVVLAIAVVAVLVLPLAARWGLRVRSEYQLRHAKPSGLLLIDSVPQNARLFIDGLEVGRTPYVAPNTFRPGSTIPMRIVYPGALDWLATFPGGVDTSLTAELQTAE